VNVNWNFNSQWLKILLHAQNATSAPTHDSGTFYAR
jgi:hypothetical protein